MITLQRAHQDIAHFYLAHQGTSSIWDMGYDAFLSTQSHAFVDFVLYHASILFIKTSILLFYVDLSKQIRIRIVLLYFGLFICVSSNIAGFFFQIFKCSPVDSWNHWQTYSCIAYSNTFIFAIGIINIITDIVIW